MKSFRTLLLSSVVLFAATSTADARTQLGSGGVSCANYLKLKQTEPAKGMAIESWILGLVSGMNYSLYLFRKGDILSDKDPTQVLNWVRTHCEKNPQKDVGSATLDYWSFLLRDLKK